MPSNPQAPASCRLATIARLADASHVHKGTCWRWLAEPGRVPVLKVGAALLIAPEVIERLLVEWMAKGGQAND